MKKSLILIIIIAAEFLTIFLLFIQNGILKNKLNETVQDVSVRKETNTYRDPLFIDEKITDSDGNSEKIIIYDNGIEEVEYPIIEGAPLNDYDFSNLTTDEKKKKMYYRNGEPAASFGIDISQYQGTIDWEKVKAEGVEFSIMRLGYRGYETGALNDDSKFLEYVHGAQSVGIDVGVYFYSQAVSLEEAAEEANYVINKLRENNISPQYPVAFDWEFVNDEDPARTDDLSHEIINQCCITFCDMISAAGYKPMYYSSITNALFKYDLNRLSGYSMWLAEYSRDTGFIYDFDMWQYSCSGVIDGIDALVDLNLFFHD